MSDPTGNTITDDLEAVLERAKEQVAVAEQVVAELPALRQKVRMLEKTLRGMREAPAPRRSAGPTINQQIIAYLESEGGHVEFPPGGMLPTVHGAIGRHKSSVQVQIHRLEGSGGIVVTRDDDGHPIAIDLPRPKLQAVAHPAPEADASELLEG